VPQLRGIDGHQFEADAQCLCLVLEGIATDAIEVDAGNAGCCLVFGGERIEFANFLPARFAPFGPIVDEQPATGMARYGIIIAGTAHCQQAKAHYKKAFHVLRQFPGLVS